MPLRRPALLRKMPKNNRAQHRANVVKHRDVRAHRGRHSMHFLQKVRIQILRPVRQKHHERHQHHQIHEPFPLFAQRPATPRPCSPLDAASTPPTPALSSGYTAPAAREARRSRTSRASPNAAAEIAPQSPPANIRWNIRSAKFRSECRAIRAARLPSPATRPRPTRRPCRCQTARAYNRKMCKVGRKSAQQLDHAKNKSRCTSAECAAHNDPPANQTTPRQLDASPASPSVVSTMSFLLTPN